MSKRKSELLIIIGADHLSEVDLAKLTADARVVEWLDEDDQQTVTFAPLGSSCRHKARTEARPEHILGRHLNGRPVFSQEARSAMRLVEGLLNDGDLVLAHDHLVEGRVCFWGAPPPKTKTPVAPIAEVVEKVSDNLQLGQSFGSSVIRAEDLQAEMQPGEAMTAVGFTIDPLESAIDQTVRLIAECQGNQEVRLTSHLDQLLALQLKRAEQAVE